MKSTLKFLSASALLTLASSFVLTGCPTADTCTTNADCDTGYICDTETNECVLDGTECATSADCTVEGEVCINSPDNSGKTICGSATSCGDVAVAADQTSYCEGQAAGSLCLPAASGDAGVVECRAATDCGELGGDADAINAFCRAAAGATEGDYTCNVDGEMPNCEGGVVSEHYQVIIKDTSTADCDLAMDANGFDPGSDISFVELQDAASMTIGWGKTVTYMPGETKNDFKESTVLDGLAPELLTEVNEAEDIRQEDVDNFCPVGDAAGRFSKTSVLTLGCGGSVIVDFPAGSEAQPLYNGYQVAVGEYAPVCNQNAGGSTTGTTDTYEVYVCPAIEVGGTAPTDVDCIMNGVQVGTETKGGYRAPTAITGIKDAPAASDS